MLPVSVQAVGQVHQLPAEESIVAIAPEYQGALDGIVPGSGTEGFAS